MAATNGQFKKYLRNPLRKQNIPFQIQKGVNKELSLKRRMDTPREGSIRDLLPRNYS